MGNREQRRQVRVVLEEPLAVVLGSIGSDVRYSLTTRSLSNGGFFLDFPRPGRFPFSSSSIMEIWLSVETDKTIFFNGKMVRAIYVIDEEAKETGGPGIAIRIIQIEPDQQAILTEFISKKLTEQNRHVPELGEDEQESEDLAS
jgi:hypothetical protein